MRKPTKTYLIFAKLKDGRIGMGKKYKYRGTNYFWVKGLDFDVDDFKAEDIEWWDYAKNIVNHYVS